MSMRRLLACAGLVTASVQAQVPDRLDVSLHYTGFGRPGWSTTKPAYVAVFDITRNNISQLYPQRPVQESESEGLARMPLHSAYSSNGYSSLSGQGFGAPEMMLASYSDPFGRYGGWRYAMTTPYTSASSFTATATYHTVLVVASNQPLRVTSPWSTPARLYRRLQAAGLYFDASSDTAMSVLINEVASTDTSSETVATWESYATPQHALYASLPRNDYLYLNCLNTGGLPYYEQTLFDSWYCLRPDKPVKPAAPKDTTVADSGLSRLKAGLITDPNEIRRIIASMIEADKRTSGSMPSKLGGAATAPHFVEPRASNEIGGNKLSPEARSSARASGPVDNSRAVPSSSGSARIEPAPRRTEPPTAPVAPVVRPSVPPPPASPAVKTPVPPTS